MPEDLEMRIYGIPLHLGIELSPRELLTRCKGPVAGAGYIRAVEIVSFVA
jgi:hypothetical protein